MTCDLESARSLRGCLGRKIATELDEEMFAFNYEGSSNHS